MAKSLRKNSDKSTTKTQSQIMLVGDINRQFILLKASNVNTHSEKHSSSLVVKEMQIKYKNYTWSQKWEIRVNATCYKDVRYKFLHVLSLETKAVAIILEGNGNIYNPTKSNYGLHTLQ